MPTPQRSFRRVLVTALLTTAIVQSSARVLAIGPQSVLPPGSAVKGWKQIGKARLYNSNNLFDLIDGEAQAVMAYSFLACAHAEYAPARQSKPVLTIDAYDMADPLNAFGLFGSDRVSGKVIPLGVEGVQIGGSGVNFWKGRYVIRTAIFQVTPASRSAQMAFAKAAAAKIAGVSATPSIVGALPPGRQPRSEKYVRSNVAGQAFLRNAITARYPSAGQSAELFICQYPSPAGARAALEQYRTYEKGGRGLTPLKGVGEAGFSVLDRYAKNVAAARKGRFVVGILRARDAASALTLVKKAIARVK